MGPASSLEYLEQKYGPTFNIIPSFGLKQGVNSKGQPKYRRIDDHSAGWVNHAAKRTQKIPMANADYIALMLRAHSEQFPGEAIHVGTADMKSAYRQVPLCDNDLKNSITAVYHPGFPEPTLHEMFGQPFGAGHAVPNFYRFAEWFHAEIHLQIFFHILRSLLRRLLDREQRAARRACPSLPAEVSRVDGHSF